VQPFERHVTKSFVPAGRAHRFGWNYGAENTVNGMCKRSQQDLACEYDCKSLKKIVNSYVAAAVVEKCNLAAGSGRVGGGLYGLGFVIAEVF
jgi:hypothetical protein